MQDLSARNKNFLHAFTGKFNKNVKKVMRKIQWKRVARGAAGKEKGKKKC